MIPPLVPEMPPTPFVDARPALDSPRAFFMRARRFIKEELPGITSEYNAWKASRPYYYDGSAPTSSGAKSTTMNAATSATKAEQK